ncbi:MAG: ABC transporter ATP-binding protein [Proteobacteria bacterium]|nr:ABC transporter ATP-binding protein [Pseudomonadota bacterium]
MPSYLTLENLTVRYGAHIVLKDIMGTFQKGSLTAIVGPNGGGKSTLLKTLMGFVSPSSGNFLNSAPKTAYLPQRSLIDLEFPLTVEEVVSFGLWQEIGSFYSFKKSHKNLVIEALNAVGMENYKKSHLQTLSGGQLQRVLFARLILQNADLILLDEPFTGIDAKTTHDLMVIVKKWHAENRTIIAVLHDLELVKRHFSDTLLLSTKTIGWGSTESVLTPESLHKIHVCSHSFSFI